MKPTFDIHFSPKHPDRPGLWLNRKSNYIGVMEIQQSDIIRDQKDPSWLEGEWGAELKLVERDVVPLTKKAIQEYLDKAILEWNTIRKHADARLALAIKQGKTDSSTAVTTGDTQLELAKQRIDCLQAVRQSLLGESLVLPEEPEDV